MGCRYPVKGREAALLMSMVIGLTLSACSEEEPTEPTDTPGATLAPGICPVTLANGRTPPGETPHPMHHGDGELYTVLHPLGVIQFDAADLEPNGSYGFVFSWWRESGIEGVLNVTAVRLDAAVPPARVHIANSDERRGFQRSEVFFLSEGCWMITARVAGSRLDVVQLVVSRQAP